MYRSDICQSYSATRCMTGLGRLHGPRRDLGLDEPPEFVQVQEVLR
jgi:hypothetical protein